MPNNVAVSITADVAGLTVGLAQASAAQKAYQKDLNDLVRATKDTVPATDAQRVAMLAAADGVARAKAQVALINGELRGMAGGAKVAEEALGGVHSGMAGITRESLVMARELSRGNFNRMAGSATILAGKLGLLTPEFLLVAAGVVAVAAPMVAFGIAAEQGSEEVAKFNNSLEATNGISGVTISQIQVTAQTLANFAHEGVGTATKELMNLAASGKFTGQTLALIGADSTRMSQLTGESADKFNAEFEKMDSGVAKFAQEYQEHYHQLTTAQVQYIQQLEDQGRKEEAEHALAEDVYNYLGKQAPENLGFLETAWRTLGATVAGVWDDMKSVGRNSNADQMHAIQEQIGNYQRLIAGEGGAGRNPNLDAELAAAQKQLAVVQQNEAAAERLAQIHGHDAQVQTDGVAAAAKLHEQFEASRTSGEKLKITLQEINDNLNKAVAADPTNKALYEQEAAAARAQAAKSDTPKTPKAKADSGAGDESDMQALQEEFDKEEASHNTMITDMKASELAYWSEIQGLAQAMGLTSKDQAAIRIKVDQLTHEQAIQGIRDEIAARQDADTHDIDEIQQKASRQKEATDQQIKDVEDAEKKGVLSKAQATVQIKALIDQQEKDAEDAANRILAIRIATDKFIEALAAEGTAEYKAAKKDEVDATKQAGDAIIAAEVAKAAKLSELARQTADNSAKAWKEANSEILSAENELVSGIMGGRETLGQILERLALETATKEIEADVRYWTEHALLNAEIGASDAATEKGGLLIHLLTQTQKTAAVVTSQTAQTAATAAGNAARVTSDATAATTSKAITAATAGPAIMADAAQAAGGAYKAVVGIPIVGPILAPAAAAVAFSGVAAYKGLASLDVGTNVLPTDMIAQIHAGERIIPKADNTALMNAVAAGPGRGDGDGTGGGGGHTINMNGDYHYHAATDGSSPDDFRAALKEHRHEAANQVRQAIREGNRAKPGSNMPF